VAERQAVGDAGREVPLRVREAVRAAEQGQAKHASMTFGIISQSKFPCLSSRDQSAQLGIIGHNLSIIGWIWGMKHREFGQNKKHIRPGPATEAPPLRGALQRRHVLHHQGRRYTPDCLLIVYRCTRRALHSRVLLATS